MHDGKKEYYAFSVDEPVLAKYMLHKGMDLDEKTLANIEKEADLYKAYVLTIQYLSYRMRTKKEIRDYLIKKEIFEDAIPDIIDRLVSEGLVNDLEFAKMFTRTRIETSLKGPAVVKREMIEKGVARELAEEAIQLYTYEIQYEKASKLIEKKLNQTQKDSNVKVQQKLQQFMMQKGFSSDIIQELMQDVKEKQGDEQEKQAIVHQGEKLKRKYQRRYTGTELSFKIKTGLYRYGFSSDLIQEYVDNWLTQDEEESF